MGEPSTGWREQIAPDEDKRFAAQAAILTHAHGITNVRYGKGRLLHRKPVLAAKGRFEVLSGLPEAARHGLFARPATYDAVVRLSNAGADVKADAKPDIRGFALKVLGQNGPSALGGTTDHQDFLMVNVDTFGAASSDEFVGVVGALAKGQLAVLIHLFATYGLGGGLARVKKVAAALGKPFTGFASEKFNSLAAITIGPYAARVRLAPVAPARPGRGKDYAGDMRERLAAGAVAYELALQFFTDEATTPIEDVTVAWPESASPFVTVARLTLTAVEPDVEGLAVDPWGGLAEHRPLGEIMRARKNAYYLSQKARGAA